MQKVKVNDDYTSAFLITESNRPSNTLRDKIGFRFIQNKNLGLQIIDMCLSPKSRTGVDAVHKASAIVETKAYDIPPYLRLTPVGLAKEEQYSYDRYDCFHKIQYLPEELKDLDLFPSFNANRYEQQLKAVYDELRRTRRTSDLKKLYSK